MSFDSMLISIATIYRQSLSVDAMGFETNSPPTTGNTTFRCRLALATAQRQFTSGAQIAIATHNLYCSSGVDLLYTDTLTVDSNPNEFEILFIEPVASGSETVHHYEVSLKQRIPER